MNHSQSRRAFVQSLALTAGAVAILRTGRATAADLPHVDPKDAAAASLGYVDDASKLDAKSTPGFVAGRSCANCLQLKGNPGDPYRPCTIFPGKLVAAKGWCKVWAAQI
jgi:hypothetical protein